MSARLRITAKRKDLQMPLESKHISKGVAEGVKELFMNNITHQGEDSSKYLDYDKFHTLETKAMFTSIAPATARLHVEKQLEEIKPKNYMYSSRYMQKYMNADIAKDVCDEEVENNDDDTKHISEDEEEVVESRKQSAASSNNRSRPMTQPGSRRMFFKLESKNPAAVINNKQLPPSQFHPHAMKINLEKVPNLSKLMQQNRCYSAKPSNRSKRSARPLDEVMIRPPAQGTKCGVAPVSILQIIRDIQTDMSGSHL